MLENEIKFKSLYPDAFFIDSHHFHDLTDYLRRKGWIGAHERVMGTEKPGEGNMNLVYRVTTDARSLIIKQARPWVEKYPHIEAPTERIDVEALFYHLLSKRPGFQPYMPALIGYDKASFILALEDLGQHGDYTFGYQKAAKFADQEVRLLLEFITKLHNTDFSAFRGTFPANQALKKLNHEHIFLFPYQEDNGFDLDTVQEGLHQTALPLKQNSPLKASIRQLGEIYLGQGWVLIHGDCYPGSWLKTPSGPKVIDPEFAFFGRPEFEMGVMVAHLKMARYTDEKVRELLQEYQKPQGFEPELCTRFCGVELLRRIIGLAQLPLDLTLMEKEQLLAWAQLAILAPRQKTFL
jgi:5-methylthioribose kinase